VSFVILWWIQLLRSRERLRSIVMSTFVCVSVCPRGYLRNHTRNLCQIFCACCQWPWFGRPPASLRYVMWLTSFFGWHHFFYNGLYSGINFATNNSFFLHLFIYRKVRLSDKIQPFIIKGHHFYYLFQNYSQTKVGMEKFDD